VIVPAEYTEGLCNIGSSGGHRVHTASNDRLVYHRIAGFFVGLPHLKLHSHWHGNWSGLIHSARRQDRPNVAVLTDVDLVLLAIVFDVHAKIERNNREIMHPEPLRHLVLNRPIKPSVALIRWSSTYRTIVATTVPWSVSWSTNSPPFTCDASNPMEITKSIKVPYQTWEDRVMA